MKIVPLEWVGFDYCVELDGLADTAAAVDIDASSDWSRA